jgi:hypothetical protein
MTDWSRFFDEPISLPNRRLIRALLDAGRYVEALPRAKYERPEWQLAMETLLLAAEGRGPVMFAHIALIRALQSG